MNRLIAGVVSLLFCSSMTMAQTSFSAYQEMLDDMYRQTVPLIQPEEVSDGMILLDTREMNEYAVSHLPGARLIPYEGFQIGALEDVAKDARIVVYCSVGYRSERIGEQLLAAGYTNVSNLYGGIFNWKYQGNEVVGMNGEATERIHTYNEKWSQWCLSGEKVW